MTENHLLIMDDDTEVAAFFAHVGRSLGFEVRTLDDPNKFFETIGEFKPNLLILDLQMPNQSGTDFYRRLMKQDELREIPIIVFTIFGGIQIFWGPIFGALVLTVMPEFLRVIQEWRMELYGAILILMMIVRPQGVIGMDTVQWIRKPFEKKADSLSAGWERR